MGAVKGLKSLQALCRLGLPAEQFVPALVELLHDVVPSYRNLFDWTDERANLVRYFFEGPIDARIASLYFEEFHNRREAEAMPEFSSLADLPAGVRGAAELANARFYRSALYHEIWKPQHFHTRLEAVVRGPGGQLFGSLVLYRGPDDLPFNAVDEARLAGVLPDIARALQSGGAAVPNEPLSPAPEPAESVLLTIDGALCHASAGAHALLLRLDVGATPALLQQPMNTLADGLLQRLLARLRALPDAAVRAGTARSVTLTQRGDAGAVQATATALVPLREAPCAQPLVQVALRRLEPQRITLERALRALPLTAGQMAVCRELYHGRSQPEIARRLGVRPATVVDHVRKAYGELGVHSALELRALLDARIPR